MSISRKATNINKKETLANGQIKMLNSKRYYQNRASKYGQTVNQIKGIFLKNLRSVGKRDDSRCRDA